MKPMINAMRLVLRTLVAGAALAATGAAFAEVYIQQQPAQPRYEEPEAAPAPGVAVTLGWHGDRYWDGHRYWEHDEWMEHHPRERDPRRDHGDERHDY